MQILPVQKQNDFQELFGIEIPGTTQESSSQAVHKILAHFNQTNLIKAYRNKDKEIPVEFWANSQGNHNLPPTLKGEFRNCKKILLKIVKNPQGKIESCTLIGSMTRIVIFRNLADFSLESYNSLLKNEETSFLPKICSLSESLLPQNIQQCADWFNDKERIEKEIENFIFCPLKISQFDSFLNFKRLKAYNTEKSNPTSSQKAGKLPYWVFKYAENEEELQIPTQSEATGEKVGVPEGYIQILRDIFEKRPIWTKIALEAQIKDQILARDSNLLRKILPIVAYNFWTGPWRRCWIRYGYDPRKHPESRFFQVLILRNNYLSLKDASTIENLNTKDFISLTEESYKFNGKKLGKNLSTFQFCDIEEEDCKALVEFTPISRTIPSISEGWYPDGFVEKLREVVGFKIDLLLKDLNWVCKPFHRRMQKNKQLRTLSRSGGNVAKATKNEEQETSENESE